MMLANLTGLLADAADAAETYVAEARQAVGARVAVDGRLDREALDREQHVAHGLAWAAADPAAAKAASFPGSTERRSGRLRSSRVGGRRLASAE